MAGSMLVSCVIPTKNRPEMTCRAIASVVGQESVAEIIVVDDGSTDHTAEQVSEFFPEVILLRRSGLGPGGARNAGVEVSTGKVIMFLDSDDLWLPGHSSALLRTLARGFEVAYGTGLNIDRLNGGEFLVPDDGQGIEGQCLDALANWCFVLTPSVAVTKNAFIRSGGFGNGDLAEDWVFYIRLARFFSFGFVGSAPLFERHLHGGSQCANVDVAHIVSSLKAVELALIEAGVGGESLQRFRAMQAWTRRHGARGWNSIQQWYLSLQKAGLV